MMVTVSPGSLRISSEKCLAETTISPLASVLLSTVQEIAIFKSMACTYKIFSAAIIWIPEKIGAVGLEEMARCTV